MSAPGTRRFAVFFILAVLVAAYSSFLTTDLLGLETCGAAARLGREWSRWVKFASIVLCFVLTLLIDEDGHGKRDRRLLQLALALTCAADWSIGIQEEFLIGVGFFFLVQIVFIVRHSRGFRWNWKEIGAAGAIYGVGIVILVKLAPMLRVHGGVVLLAAGVFYGLTLLTSVWFGVATLWRDFYPNKTTQWFIAVGILFFFCCDVNVGLAEVLARVEPQQLPAPFRLLPHPASGCAPQELERAGYGALVFGLFAWYFYLPAQTLLALSGYRIAALRSVLPVIPDRPETG